MVGDKCDPELSPLSLVFHPSFWGLERRNRTHSYILSQPLGQVYWIGLDRGGCVEWTEAMSLWEVCVKTAERVGIPLPYPVPEQEILPDLLLIAQDVAFRRLQPVSYPDGTPVEEMDRGGRRFSLSMEGRWWDDWRLYGNIPFDLTGIVRRAAEEIRSPHLEEYAPWKRLDALLEPILGPEHRHWYMCWSRPYGVHAVYRRQDEMCSLHLGDPCEVSRMAPEEIQAKLPPEVLEYLEHVRKASDGEQGRENPELEKNDKDTHADGSAV